MAKRKSNWDRLQSKSDHDSIQYRDVYEDQQLERSKIQEKQSPMSRIIFTVILTILVMLVAYVLVGLIQFGFHLFSNNMGGVSQVVVTSTESGEGSSSSSTLTYNSEDPYNYIKEIDDIDPMTGMTTKYQALDVNGEAYGPVYDTAKEVPEPEWYSVAKSEYETEMASLEGQKATEEENEAKATLEEQSNIGYWMMPDLLKILITLFVGLIFFLIMYQVMMRNLAAQNLMNDTSDINQYQNDQHVALPEEVMRKFDWFPDVGAHTNVQPSSMISHVALLNKGLNGVMMAKRAKSDIKDEDGDIEYLKGEILCDDDDNALMEKKPMFDTDFMEDLFDASGMLKDKKLRKYYDATKIPYNPNGENRDKQDYNTVADLINNDWVIPEYETQRPAGAYIVDIDPVNTMVLAITRAGKGETAQLVA